MSEPLMLCANCGCNLDELAETAESQLYSPDEEFELCVPCADEEEALVEEEGTNDIPYMVDKYRRVVRNEWR